MGFLGLPSALLRWLLKSFIKTLSLFLLSYLNINTLILFLVVLINESNLLWCFCLISSIPKFYTFFSLLLLAARQWIPGFDPEKMYLSRGSITQKDFMQIKCSIIYIYLPYTYPKTEGIIFMISLFLGFFYALY